MELSDLLKYDEIVIQCHDNPDADAIASGFGVYTFFKEKGKYVRFVYSGRFTIQKSNLLLMVNDLDIPIEKVDTIDEPELLITVDCQYGEGNVTNLPCKNVAVIDHHQVVGKLPELNKVRSNMGSCSTIVWDMLHKENIEMTANLETALYYGLYTDTNGFSELSHPLDRDLRDEAKFNRSLIRKFNNSNVSMDELTIAGQALINYKYNEEYRFAVVEAEPCDPNILGFISDLLLVVDMVDTCIVYTDLPFGIKLSVRSCVRETKASDLVAYVVKDVGSGGGHLDKAGGFIKKELLGDRDADEFLISQMKEYFRSHEVIYAETAELDVSSMHEYVKLPVETGYVEATDVAPVGTIINIRTLEGDMEIEVTEDTIISIGIEGEIYPTMREKYLRSYVTYDEPFEFKGDYPPTVKRVKEGNSLSLLKYAKKAVATGGVHIYARPLTKAVKVFTAWDNERYMSGKVGDFIACREDDYHDIYVIREDIFYRTYEEV